jgi:hypothetical protein
MAITRRGSVACVYPGRGTPDAISLDMDTNRRPEILPGESLVAYLARLDAWKAQGDWFPASNGTETPFTARSGARLLYCWQARSGRHAYLNLGTDVVLTDDEARMHLGTC